MIKLLAISTAACLAGICLFGPGALACDEDCAEEMHEAAYERAYEHTEAREEAAEEGYVVTGGGRGASRSDSRREQATRGETRKAPPARTESRVAEPKPDSAPQPEPQPRSKRDTGRGRAIVDENSSISTGDSRYASDDSYERPASVKPVGCKTYFPSVGMTVSVPCD